MESLSLICAPAHDATCRNRFLDVLFPAAVGGALAWPAAQAEGSGLLVKVASLEIEGARRLGHLSPVVGDCLLKDHSLGLLDQDAHRDTGAVVPHRLGARRRQAVAHVV